MNLKALATELFLLVLSLALGLTLNGATAQIVLFSIAGMLLLVLVIGAFWNSDRFWRQVAKKVDPHVERGDPNHEAGDNSSDLQFAAAIDDLLDELATIHSRLTEALDAGFYGYKFFLPTAAYAANRNVISARSSEAREVLSEVYVAADALNHKMPSAAVSDGIAIEHVPTPDGARLREVVSRAQATLRQLRP
ncbi:MAG TPA: hypothetical protein VF125_05975 [Solirubrobacterales bacterium]